MVFLGSTLMASAVEEYGLHRRFAKVLLTCTKSHGDKGLLFGFISTTGLLSMWLSNSATAALMAPLAKAVFESQSQKATSADRQQVKVAIDLGIAFAASLGGMATLTGTGSNIVLHGTLEHTFSSQGESEREELSFIGWFLLACPLSVVNLLLLWVFLDIWCLRGGRCGSGIRREREGERENEEVNYASKLSSQKRFSCCSSLQPPSHISRNNHTPPEKEGEKEKETDRGGGECVDILVSLPVRSQSGPESGDRERDGENKKYLMDRETPVMEESDERYNTTVDSPIHKREREREREKTRRKREVKKQTYLQEEEEEEEEGHMHPVHAVSRLVPGTRGSVLPSLSESSHQKYQTCHREETELEMERERDRERERERDKKIEQYREEEEEEEEDKEEEVEQSEKKEADEYVSHRALSDYNHSRGNDTDSVIILKKRIELNESSDEDKLSSSSRLSFAEWIVLLSFLTMGLLWLTRDPPGNWGWARLLSKPTYATDGTVAMLCSLVLFITPMDPLILWHDLWSTTVTGELVCTERRRQTSRRSVPNSICKEPETGAGIGYVHTILNWSSIEKINWDVVFLLGGGFALSEAFQTSGLAVWLGQLVAEFGPTHLPALVMMACLLAVIATNVMSNVATANILLPALACAGPAHHKNPLVILAPIALSTSLAFVFPIATPPNAIILANGNITFSIMAKAGIIMTIVSLSTTLIFTLCILP
eukprot:CAMPEP_0182422324 /NCGR_PEP_ID=MMETSP1167-20130531/7982_1 /TAXON_ID=2988 /ORGANISM="Mallomonas Sp, Strain CCMP3275" /LENGTH=713 /DNA_ID=CAMNT_0024600291 /DNA_START=313 /DNA_END=2450 /DNA_ORIENTATION=+